MTVKELVAELRKLPQEHNVLVANSPGHNHYAVSFVGEVYGDTALLAGSDVQDEPVVDMEGRLK